MMYLFGLLAACWRPGEIEEPCAAPATVTVRRVIDGDTVEVDPPVTLDGVETSRIRLLCIDTPETDGVEECWGQEAKDYTTEHLEGEKVDLIFDRDCTDLYGRGLAYVRLRSGALFNMELAREGHAVLIDDYFADYTWCPAIAEATADARAAGAGGWGACSGDPWIAENAE